MGGYAGAAIAKAGFGSIIYGGWTMTLVFIVTRTPHRNADRVRFDGHPYVDFQ